MSEWKNIFKKKPKEVLSHCLNCKTALHPDALYCSNCGQRATQSKVGFWSLIGTFLSTVFNIDSNLWASLVGIFRPGYLSKKYIAGERKKYLHPIRMFFVALLVQFALFNLFINIDQVDKIERNNIAKSAKVDMYQEYVDVVDAHNIDTSITAPIEEKLFSDIAKGKEDSISINISNIIVPNGSLSILRKDVYEMPIDSIYTKYSITKVAPKIIVRQFVKTTRNLSGSIRYIIGNTIWGVITTLFLIAWLMKLLYVRKRRLYVEHAVVMSHIHSFAFIFGSILTAIAYFFRDSEGVLVDLMTAYGAVLGLYIIWAFKAYYGQGLIKTLIKLAIIGILYLIVFAISVSLVLLISLLFV